LVKVFKGLLFLALALGWLLEVKGVLILSGKMEGLFGREQHPAKVCISGMCGEQGESMVGRQGGG